MATGREMCETIVRAGILSRKDGTTPTAEEIWSYSLTGELFMVWIWYLQALQTLGLPLPDNNMPQMAEIYNALCRER